MISLNKHILNFIQLYKIENLLNYIYIYPTMSKHPYQWYTGINHPMQSIVFISVVELDIILNDPLRHSIIQALPLYSIRIEQNELYIQITPGVYHSLYDELNLHNSVHIVQHIQKCPRPMIRYIYYCMLKEMERRRLAAAI